MARFELGAMALLLIGCGGNVAHAPDPGDAPPIAGAGAANAAAGSSVGGRSESMDPGGPTTSGGAPASAAGASVGGAASDPEPEAGDGGSDGPSAEPVRTLVDLPAKLRGFISGVQYEPDAATTLYSAQADFESSRGSWDGCTQVTLGQCWYYDCPDGSYPFRVIGGSTLQNAGDLFAAASENSTTPVRMLPLPDFFYETDVGPALWPRDGGTVKFVASGAAVPAFSITVSTPPSVTLSTVNGAPAPTTNVDEDGDPLPVPIQRSDGLKLTWTAHGKGTALLMFWGFEAHRFAATCEFDAAAGRGELPAALLKELEPGSLYNLTFRGSSLARTTVGDWEIEAQLSAVGGPMSPYLRWPVDLR